ncbi:hypothetical protein N2152v2_006525 [Parachlorella kessleri]
MGKQEFMAVQCCQCSAFQVQQVKKVNKFACSMCSYKQSVQRVFAKSNQAKDIREVVQAYNGARSCIEAESEQAALAGTCGQWQPAEEELWRPGLGGQAEVQAAESKWAGFVEDESEQWTVVLPERPPAAQAVGKGAKRRRLQQQGMQCGSRSALVGKQQLQQQTCEQQQQQTVQRPGCARTVAQPVGTAWQPQAVLQQSLQAGWRGGQRQATGGAGKWASFVGDDDE